MKLILYYSFSHTLPFSSAHMKTEDIGKPQGKMYSPMEDFLYINNISVVVKGKLRRKGKRYNHMCILLGRKYTK